MALGRRHGAIVFVGAGFKPAVVGFGFKAEYIRQDAVRHGGRTLQGCFFFDGRVKTGLFLCRGGIPIPPGICC